MFECQPSPALGLLGLQRSLGGFSTCQTTSCFSKASSHSRSVGKAPEQLLQYLESGPEAVDVAGVTQGRLQGVGDHAAHAAPGALGQPGGLGVGEQRVADGLGQQLRVSKDENPAGAAEVGKGGDADPHHPYQGWQEQLTFHFFHCCCGVPLLTLSPHQGQLPGSQNNSGTGGMCPPKSKFSEVLDVTQLRPSRG